MTEPLALKNLGTAPAHFADRLDAAIARKRSCLVVGIDPVLDRLPHEVVAQVPGLNATIADPGRVSCARAAAAFALFAEGVIHATADHAVAIKPNTAFFERFGAAGWDALHVVCRKAQAAGLLVITDAKRGDIDSTAEAYADAFLGDRPDTVGAHTDALTVNPYLGTDGMKPFLAAARRGGKGLFVLVRTSNPSAAELQDRELDGAPLYARVAELVARWGGDLLGSSGLSAVGAVVGATASRQAVEIRALLPNAVFLVPGYGAQGADADAIRPNFRPGGRGAIVNASRSVIFAYEKERSMPWQEAVRRAAQAAKEDLERVRRNG